MKLNWNKYLYPQVNQPLFQILDREGKIVLPELISNYDDETLIKGYKLMHLARMHEEISIKYAKNNQLFNFAPAIGQEAIQIAIGLTVEPQIDWVVSSFRENPLWITLNKPMVEAFQYWSGFESGNATPKSLKILPLNVLIATQFSHAVGIALANKIQNLKGIVITMIGDGGTSEGEFYAAMNMAAVMNLKIIFIIQNNQWAISTPLEKETNCTNLAEKGIGVGINALKIDGNDFLASYYALAYAKEYVEKNNKPFLLEAKTYRIGPHTAHDDPTRYRDQKKHEELIKSDPLIRFKKFLIKKNLWDESKELNLTNENKNTIEENFNKVQNTPSPLLKDIYAHNYAKMPNKLKTQYEEWELRFKETDNND